MRSRAIKDISLRISAVVLLSLISYGCAGIGPGTIARDRFDYTTAISDSWKRQMLLNMVMIRYGDAPMFLDVASIINQYSVETDASGSLFWAFPPAANSQAISGHATYTDRPTITYNPLMGQKFAQNLMTPIPTASSRIRLTGKSVRNRRALLTLRYRKRSLKSSSVCLPYSA